MTIQYCGIWEGMLTKNNSIEFISSLQTVDNKVKSKVEKINRREILPSSNSIPNWHSNLSPNGEAFGVPF